LILYIKVRTLGQLQAVDKVPVILKGLFYGYEKDKNSKK
jgi:hypothetical protein